MTHGHSSRCARRGMAYDAAVPCAYDTQDVCRSAGRGTDGRCCIWSQSGCVPSRVCEHSLTSGAAWDAPQNDVWRACVALWNGGRAPSDNGTRGVTPALQAAYAQCVSERRTVAWALLAAVGLCALAVLLWFARRRVLLWRARRHYVQL